LPICWKALCDGSGPRDDELIEDDAGWKLDDGIDACGLSTAYDLCLSVIAGILQWALLTYSGSEILFTYLVTFSYGQSTIHVWVGM